MVATRQLLTFVHNSFVPGYNFSKILYTRIYVGHKIGVVRGSGMRRVEQLLSRPEHRPVRDLAHRIVSFKHRTRFVGSVVRQIGLRLAVRRDALDFGTRSVFHKSWNR
jgi:hypothetical protein